MRCCGRRRPVLRRPLEPAQYASEPYRTKLAAHGLKGSMGRRGNPYDNAKAESFMATLKREQIDGRPYRDLAEATIDIGAFIEAVYNRQRLHSALGYRSPEEFEALQPTLPRPGAADAAPDGSSAPPAPNNVTQPNNTPAIMQPVSP